MLFRSPQNPKTPKPHLMLTNRITIQSIDISLTYFSSSCITSSPTSRRVELRFLRKIESLSRNKDGLCVSTWKLLSSSIADSLRPSSFVSSYMLSLLFLSPRDYYALDRSFLLFILDLSWALKALLIELLKPMYMRMYDTIREMLTVSKKRSDHMALCAASSMQMAVR